MNPSEKRTITAEDLYSLEILTACEISPDGKSIIYTLQTVDRESEKKYSHIWSISSDGGTEKQLTFGKQTDSKPKWSPDGNWIAFLSNRIASTQQQIFVLPISGGEAHPITDLSGDIGDFDWSPDSKKLVFTFRPFDEVDIEMKTDEKKKELGRVSRRVTKRVFFKLDAYGYLPDERFHIWVVDIESLECKQTTHSENHEETSPAWSPDGKSIAYVSNVTEDPDLSPDHDDIFMMDLESGESRKFKTPIGPKGHLSFSPNGKKLAYLGHEDPKADYKNSELWVIDLDKPGSTRSLTAKFDFDVGGGVINDIGGVQTATPVWAKDGNELFFQVGRHGRTSLHSVNLAGEVLKTILEFKGVVITFSLDQTQEKIAYLQGTMTDPCQVALYSFKDKTSKVLTEINKDLFGQLELGSIEEVWFKGPNNNDLQGWILKPPHFNENSKYASIMEIHGGPLAQYGFFIMHEFFYLAAQGYVIYFSNPRGGQGYGEEHAKSIFNGNWGTVDFADLMAWADFMEKKPYIDPNEMGVTGGSYGGYMTLWIIGHTNRFKAAVAQRSVSNLISMWGSSDFNWSFQKWFDDKAPYENLEVLWQCSPMKHIGNAKTPTLIIHSMQDLRCSIEQSEQAYVALKNLGVDTEFLMFPDSPHGVSRSGRTDRKVARLEGIFEWFRRYLIQ